MLALHGIYLLSKFYISTLWSFLSRTDGLTERNDLLKRELSHKKYMHRQFNDNWTKTIY